ncbi:MAG TPA: hypothetical protein PLD99_01590 [Parcubacteria group bacterium]|nr:hypothetical protein [Parcubacteria group bacterium]
MKVVEVVPIVKGFTRETLSYFSKESFAPGSFVKIPLRNGSILGIVESTVDVSQKKSLIKKAGFPLKKISLAPKQALSRGFMKAVETTSKFYATSSGSVLGTLLTKFFLDNPNFLKKNSRTNSETSEVKLIQLSEEERYREYRGVIRESFAKGSSVMFIAPTKKDLDKAKNSLNVGIEKFVYSTAGITPKGLKKLFLKIHEEKHPVLIITSMSNCVFDRPDLDLIIVERENSRAYRGLKRPYLDYKMFLKNYTKECGKSLIFGDSVLSLETLWLEKEGMYSAVTPLTWRLKDKASGEIIDMREKKEFEIISEKLQKRIKMSLTENKKIFLFGVRKGLSSTTACGDCGSLLLCKNCSSPLVLHTQQIQGETLNYYKCHHCGAKRTAETRCDSCQSWKLTPLGIGIDTIAKECREKMPEVNVFILSKEHTPTKSKAVETVKRFFDTPQSILIGTEMAIEYLESVPTVGVVSLDSLFSIPNFYINERIFYLVTRLKEITGESFLIQTRNAGVNILEWATAGNILDFYRSEIEEREDLHYPPFSYFIKISFEGTIDKVEAKSILLKNDFELFNPHFMIKKSGQGKTAELTMIIRISRENWPDESLQRKLLLLTPDFLIKVDPESIF